MRSPEKKNVRWYWLDAVKGYMITARVYVVVKDSVEWGGLGQFLYIHIIYIYVYIPNVLSLI